MLGIAVASGPVTPTALRPPVQGSCVSSPFGWRALSVPVAGHAHPGIDLAAVAGAPVLAAASGRVVAVHRRGLGGLSVAVQHAGGRVTFYAHLGTLTPAFAEGKTAVAAGEALGRVGRTGMNFGAHLYFAVWDRGVAIDPEPLIGVPRCR